MRVFMTLKALTDARRNVMPTVPYPRLNTVNSAMGSEPSADTQAPPDSTPADSTPADSVPATGATSTALLRMYRPASGDHLYTISVGERDNAVGEFGYVDEGVACQVFATAGPGTTALLRVYNEASGDHFYTISVAERDNAVAADGYVDEGVACHVYPN
jgi:hypothetical protein